MSTPEIIALADQVRAHLDRGGLAGLGPIHLVPDGGVLPDAEIAARIVLADVAHCLQLEREANLPLSATSWAGLAAQLRCFERALHGRVAAREALQGDLTAQMPAILWSTDAELRLTAATGMGLVEVGRGPALRGAGPLARLLGVDEPDSAPRAAHRRALQGETAAYECEWRGSAYRTHIAPLRGPDGAIVGTVGVALDITEARQADSAQPPGEERFRLALQGTPVIVYRQDTELRHTWIYNPQHGFSPETVLGKTDAELVRPEEAAIQAVIKRRVMETGVGAREVVRVTVGGEAAYYDLTIEPLRGPAGEIIGITGAATNITALKQAEAALARRQAQLAEAQRLARVGSWELDLATNRLDWSDEHYRIFGLGPAVRPPPREVAWARVHPDDFERARAIWEASLRTGEPYEMEFRIVHPDGEVRIIHSRGTVHLDAAGQPERMIGTAQDVTERLRAEQERMIQREREARLAGMLFAARGIAARMNDALVLTTEALDGVRPQLTLTPALREAIDATAAGLSSVQGDLAELQRLIPPPAQGFGGPDPG